MNMEIPSLLRIGYRTFEVIPLSPPDLEMTDKYGWCDKLNAKIYVYMGDEPMMNADTLLHEVIHATWAWMGLEERHDEEAAATRLATGLINVFYDNPELLEYFLSCVADSNDDDSEEDNNNEFKLT